MKKPENMFTDLSKEQRAVKMEEFATKSKFESVKRDYSEDEKQQMKDFVVEESMQVKDQTEEFKKIQKEFNAAIKKNKEGIADSLTRIKKGYSENEEKVYMFDDQDNGVMNIYDANGEYLYTRKLYPDERQTTILNLADKTGTND